MHFVWMPRIMEMLPDLSTIGKVLVLAFILFCILESICVIVKEKIIIYYFDPLYPR